MVIVPSHWCIRLCDGLAESIGLGRQVRLDDAGEEEEAAGGDGARPPHGVCDKQGTRQRRRNPAPADDGRWRLRHGR